MMLLESSDNYFWIQHSFFHVQGCTKPHNHTMYMRFQICFTIPNKSSVCKVNMYAKAIMQRFPDTWNLFTLRNKINGIRSYTAICLSDISICRVHSISCNSRLWAATKTILLVDHNIFVDQSRYCQGKSLLHFSTAALLSKTTAYNYWFSFEGMSISETYSGLPALLSLQYFTPNYPASSRSLFDGQRWNWHTALALSPAAHGFLPEQSVHFQ